MCARKYINGLIRLSQQLSEVNALISISQVRKLGPREGNLPTISFWSQVSRLYLALKSPLFPQTTPPPEVTAESNAYASLVFWYHFNTLLLVREHCSCSSFLTEGMVATLSMTALGPESRVICPSLSTFCERRMAFAGFVISFALKMNLCAFTGPLLRACCYLRVQPSAAFSLRTSSHSKARAVM